MKEEFLAEFDKLRRRIEGMSGWSYLQMELPERAQNSMQFIIRLHGERFRDKMRINFDYSFMDLDLHRGESDFVKALGQDLIRYVKSFVHCGCKQWEDETGKVWYIKCEEHLNVN